MGNGPVVHAKAKTICEENLDGYLAKIEDDDERVLAEQVLDDSGARDHVHIGNDPDQNDPAYIHQLADGDESESDTVLYIIHASLCFQGRLWRISLPDFEATCTASSELGGSYLCNYALESSTSESRILYVHRYVPIIYIESYGLVDRRGRSRSMD